MLKIWFKRGVLTLAGAGVVALFAWLLWPQPVSVDVAVASRGPMEVTIEEEGVNRIRNVYTVSAPNSGKLLRPDVDTGDHVIAGETVVATIAPADPEILDERTLRELEAAVASARDALEAAKVQVARAESERAFARSELDKAQQLAGKRVISLSQLDKRTLELDISEKALAAAQAQLNIRQHDLEMAIARLGSDGASAGGTKLSSCCVVIKAPVTGSILTKLAESERVIQAGAPIMEIGDTRQSEIAVDLLSTDAVKIAPGTRARIKGWGGSKDLPATVTRIEPSAFTKISALGIEEQRVKTLLKLDGSAEHLGHQYRVIAEIVMWTSSDALQIPISSLVRKGEAWAVYRVNSDVAQLTEVSVGHMSGETAEILGGLRSGDTVIVHPSDAVSDGMAIAAR